MSGSARPSHPKGQSGSSPRPHHVPARKISTGSADMLRAVVMAAKKNKAKEKDKGRKDEDAVKEEEAMAWKLLSLTQINILLEQDIAGVQKYLEMFLNMREPLTSLKQAALLDYYVSGFWWAKALEFTPVQLGGLLTLLNMLMNNIETRHMTLEDNIQELRNAMAGIGRRNSEKSGGFEFFTVDQAKAIINYLKISIFQHYSLYEFLFYTPREEIVLGDENVVELVKPADIPFPAPLEEGLAYNIYSKFIVQTPGEEDATKEVEGGVPLEEEAVAETVVDPLTGYTVEDVQMVLGQITGEMLSGIQTEINERLQTQQEAYSARIDKLKKA
ncbi:ciliary-associated calcium-binding coiled-coil protein 1 isoform X1 [Lacerta agilis]|uniref:ciliary-associated calcium-binding coiled-coil protein 1 isoform X1 n=2 Tax=Lacerta agilis TaxID=80427 RepID=UPI001419CED5|nr:ciliary-associated calcium-binding coiled-coil protein 1 isoform X1 [Lacerta agilis]